MSTHELNELLRRLHAELSQAESLDPESRKLLGLVISEVRMIGTGEADGTAERTSDATPHGLEALAVRFEADHPAMAAALRQLADLLAKVGI
jgi:uncharacterized protein DUF4404